MEGERRGDGSWLRIAGEIVTNKEHEQKLRTKELEEMKFKLYLLI